MNDFQQGMTQLTLNVPEITQEESDYIINEFNLTKFDFYRNRTRRISVMKMIKGLGHFNRENSRLIDIAVENAVKEDAEKVKYPEFIPEKYRKPYTQDYWPEGFKKALEYLESFLNGKPLDFYIGGPTGTGKSHLASFLLMKTAYKGRSTYWLNTEKLYQIAKQAIDDRKIKDDLNRMKEDALKAEVLVLDDIGKSKLRTDDGITVPFFGDTIYLLTEERATPTKTTIYTSEFPSESPSLVDKLTESVVNRINDRIMKAGMPPVMKYRAWETGRM